MKFNSLSVFLSLLIITVLPFTAYAELTTDESGSPAVSDYDPPYALAEPTQADQGHIATTAYVKGAYNDAITAVNTLADIHVADYNELDGSISSVQSDVSDLSDAVDGKQDKLRVVGMGPRGDQSADISTDVLFSLNGTITDLQLATASAVKNAIDSRLIIPSTNPEIGVIQMSNQVVTNLSSVNNANQLVNGVAVKNAITDINSTIENAITDINSTIGNKRVQIYTTWGGNGTAEVAFINATPQQQGGGSRVEQP